MDERSLAGKEGVGGGLGGARCNGTAPAGSRDSRDVAAMAGEAPAGRRRASGSSRARAHGSGVSGSPHPSPVPVWPGRRAGGGARFRRLAVSLLVAVAASAFGTPALAQMTPVHCTSEPTELWCATLTVGFVSDYDLYGYIRDDIGSLSQTQFTYKGVTYTITELDYFPSDAPPYLIFDLAPNGDTVFNNDARFALRIETTDFSFGSDPLEGNSFIWENPAGLSWSDGDTVPVKLTRTNTAPTSAPGTVTTNEDTRYAFGAGDFTFSDTADSDDTFESVKITALPTAGTLSVDGTAIASGNLPKAVSKADIDADKLTYTPAPNANGSVTFNFKVNDGYDDSTLDYLMTVTITAVNDAPVLEKAIPNRSAVVGTAFSYQFPDDAFSDADGGTLAYTATKADGMELPTWLSFDPGTRTFSGTPMTADLGKVSVKVTAGDGQLSTSDEFDITVQAGTPPALTSATVVADGRATILQFDKLYAVPNAGLQLFFSTLAGSLSVTADGSTVGFDLSPPTSADLAGRRLRLANLSPTIAQGQTVVVTYTDPTSGPDDVAIEDAAGNETGTFTTDLDGVPAVTNNSTFINTAPTVANAIADQLATVGIVFSYQFPDTAFSDADGDALTYTATKADGTALPTWLSFDPGTRIFSGTPMTGDLRTVSVKVTASDVYGAPVSDTFDIRAILPDTHCNPSDPLELWCGRLTVGSLAGGAFGYASAGGWLSRSSEFTFKAVRYTINQLSNSTTPGLTLALNPHGNTVFNKNDAPVAGFALRIGTTDFSFRDSTFNVDSFSWSNPGLSWSAGDRVPVKIIRANQPIRVRDIEFSDPGPDNLYTHGEDLEIAVTFSEPVNIPDAELVVPTGYCQANGRPKAVDVAGNRTERVVFGCTIHGGPYTRVYLDANRLRPGSGGDGPRVFELHPAVEKPTAVHGLVGPAITGVSMGLPGQDGLWTDGETLKIYYTFAEPVTVATDSGTPSVWARHIFTTSFDRTLEKADFQRIEDGKTLVFSSTVRGRARKGFELPPNALSANGGVIAGTGTGALADLSHATYDLVSPCGEFPDELWCSILRVGTDGDNYGFEFAFFGVLQQYFIYRTAEISVSSLHIKPQNVLYVNFQRSSGRLPPDGLLGAGRFTLEIGTGADRKSFAIVDPGTTSEFEFSDHGLSWSPGDRIVVRLRGPASSGQQVEVEPPRVADTPAVGPAGPDGEWTEGETVEVTLAFSEAVEVHTTDGTPSVGIALGATKARQAAYLRGSGTTELVFGYTLVKGDGPQNVMAVTPDSLALNGGSIRSTETNADAALGHNGTVVQGSSERTTPRKPRAHFESVPEDHDGSAFEFELHFSANPEELNYRTVQGGLLEVEGGAVTGAERTTPPSDRGWRVTVEPSGTDDVQIRLPARACDQANAICVGGQPLDKAVSTTVRGAPFTAAFSGAPVEHDGTSPFELEFRMNAEPVGLSYRTVQNGLFDVVGGSITRAWRLVKGNNEGWGLRVEPSGFGDVTLRVRATTDCAGTPGICTASGRMLPGGLQATIAGPPTLSVADAQVEEGSGAVLDFAVTLSRPLSETVTVAYGTEDGGARAGVDYTNTTGTLTFAPSETSKTASVPVLDDGHDEGSETLTLTLSNPTPSRVKLADASAIGTITNDDPMPQAWLARFGRTVGIQVMEAVSARLDGNPSSHLTIGGVSLGGNTPLAAEPLAPQDWLAEQVAQDPQERILSGQDLLLGSSFHQVSQADDTGGPALSAWGRIATGGFQADVDDVTMDGSVTTGFLGFDAEWERLLAGLLLSHSEGDGDYNLQDGSDRGRIESALTGVYPYARLRLNGWLSAWGLAGMGSGDLRLIRQKEVIDTGLGLRLGAIGVTGTLLAGGAVDLAVKSDALWVRTDSDAETGLAAASAQVSRLRLILEFGRTFALPSESTLTPTVQVGLRHDGGDAETGTGLEVGAGLRYLAGILTVEAQVRTLLAHEAGGYEEWGASGAIRLSPHASGLGPSLAVMPAWGVPSGGVAQLWSHPNASSLVQGREAPAAGRLDAELGYGLSALRGQGILTPYARLALAEGDGQSWHLGTRLALNSSLNLSLEGSRRERADSDIAHDIALHATVPW